MHSTKKGSGDKLTLQEGPIKITQVKIYMSPMMSSYGTGTLNRVERGPIEILRVLSPVSETVAEDS